MISGLNHRLIGRGALQGKRFAAPAQTYLLSACVGELFDVVRRNAAHPKVFRLEARTFCFIAAPAVGRPSNGLTSSPHREAALTITGQRSIDASR